MISQGSIQEHTFEFERQGVTSATVSFRVTYEMVPKVKVLGVFAREDGELIADLIELEVHCEFQNDVSQTQVSCPPPFLNLNPPRHSSHSNVNRSSLN